MHTNPVTDQAVPRPTRKAQWHVAPCWSTQRVIDIGSSKQEQFAILLFGEELDLAEGLRQMKDKGWEVIEVQRNHDRRRRQLPVWIQPDFYYLFERTRHQKVLHTGKPAHLRPSRPERNREAELGKGH